MCEKYLTLPESLIAEHPSVNADGCSAVCAVREGGETDGHGFRCCFEKSAVIK